MTPIACSSPLLRRPDGSFDEVSWEEAFTFIDERLRAIDAEHGREAMAMYFGNPAAHHLGLVLYGRVLAKALGTRNIFSASTVDQYPKQLASGLMFGTGLSVPVPDLDRTSHLLILGADPMVSNGSLMTSPDARGRLRAIRARGGKIVVVDPRRSRTAMEADEHHFIRPGTDALLLFALAHVLFDEDLADPGAHLEPHLTGLETVRELAAPFTPDAVARATGIDAQDIRRMARELAAAPTAAVYGRIGTTTQEFGSLASWLVDVLNVLTGNLDREGGAMFTMPAAGSGNTTGTPGRGRGVLAHRWTSRVSGRGEVFGEFPAACLAEEITTPGDGRIRALFTIAGNPVLSTPRGDRLAEALDTLDLMVSIDVYRNETTRHADVILPGPSPLMNGHFDIALYAVRRAQRRELLTADVPAARGRARRVADPAAPGRDRLRAGPRRRHRRGRHVRGHRARTPRDTAAGPRGPRSAGADGRRRPARRPGAAARHPAAQRPLRRPVRRARGRADAGRAGGRPARDRPRAAEAAHPGGAAHRRRDDRARARSCCCPTCRGCARRSPPPTRTGCC